MKRNLDPPGFLASRLFPFLERRHVDHETIFHIALQHPLVRFVDLVHRNLLDVANDPALRAIIEHLLGLSDSANERAGKTAAAMNQTEGIDGERIRRRAYQHEGAVAL